MQTRYLQIECHYNNKHQAHVAAQNCNGKSSEPMIEMQFSRQAGESLKTWKQLLSRHSMSHSVFSQAALTDP